MFKRLGSILPAVFALSQAVAAPAREEGTSPPAPPPRSHPIRVLVITGGHGFEHEPFFEVFKNHPDIKFKEVTQPTALEYFAPEKAGEYDVMVWYDLWEKISDQDKKNLVDLLNKGKPLVALHHCLSDYMEWPEAGKILGGRYWIGDRPHHTSSTYTGNQTYTAHLADPDHPITRFMKDFEVVDETYGNLEVSPDVKPLITVEHPKSNKITAWTHTYGKSPVVYIQAGHGPGVFANPNYRRLVAQAIRWAAGRLPDRQQEGFVDLIKPGGFDGWKFMGDPKGFWWTQDKTLRSESGKGGEWMRTEKEYGDFILRAEWKVGNGGNSGVFIRCLDKDKGWPWETGSEVQISNEPRDPAHCTGSLYGSVAVNPRPDESADVWHEFWIECRGTSYKVFADNVPIIDVDSRVLPALAKRPLHGYIGLQDSHNRESFVEFRRVAVKELAPVRAAGSDGQSSIEPKQKAE